LSSTPWKCKLEGNSFQIGQRFSLLCEGEAVDWKADSLKLQVPKGSEKQYSLKSLSVLEAKPEQISFEVAGYLPGKHTAKDLELTDGTHTVKLSDFEWEITSVFPMQMQPPPTPHPSHGPVELDLPFWYIFMVVAIVIACLGSILGGIYLLNRRKKLLDEMASFKTPNPPYNEFYRIVRQTARQINKEDSDNKILVQELQKEFQLYLTRELEVPAYRWPIGKVLARIKRKHKRVYKNSHKNVRKLWRELNSLKKHSDDISKSDIQQITRLCSRTVDSVWRSHREENPV
jgi:hypothetical protein